MRVLASSAQAERHFQQSRFLGILEPVTSPEAARAELRAAKARYGDATHVVHAFRTGEDNSETCGSSDDGEPSGTAGRPVLDVLRGSGGGQALLLVVRWFGGTKLGTGGLVKAYGDTAKAVIASAVWKELRHWVVAEVSVEWNEYRPLKARLVADGAQCEEEFGAAVVLKAQVPLEAFEEIQRFTVDLTRGRCRWRRID